MFRGALCAEEQVVNVHRFCHGAFIMELITSPFQSEIKPRRPSCVWRAGAEAAAYVVPMLDEQIWFGHLLA